MSTTFRWDTPPAEPETASYPLEDLEAPSDRVGGLKVGSVFFGWLCAHALAVLLASLCAGGVAALGLAPRIEQQARALPEITALVGAGVVVVIVSLGYYAGGYVAGRMARLDGRRQGFAVWLFGLVVTGGLIAAGLFTGVANDVLGQLDLVSLELGQDEARVGGLAAAGVLVLLTLIGACAGGKTGERYHRRVDRAVLRA